jgi:hypothetical protein
MVGDTGCMIDEDGSRCMHASNVLGFGIFVASFEPKWVARYKVRETTNYRRRDCLFGETSINKRTIHSTRNHYKASSKHHIREPRTTRSTSE